MELCANCGLEVEDRARPSMGNRTRPAYVHVNGGYSICFPQQPNSPKATPTTEGRS